MLCLVTDQLAVAYEFRQKNNPYDSLDNIIEDEDNWHTIAIGYVFNDRLTVSAGWGHFGNIFNTDENCVWGIQVKYEF